ncbi:MAG: YlxR family protein [Firmicutes bacterium]|nr:YlxR family protein [Bacillota bacterium]
MKTRKTPMRRCAGCMESKPKNELLRIACYEGVVSVDPTGKAKGRGIYICPSEDCLAKAKKKKALQRSFGAELTQEQEDQLLQEIREYDAR